MVTRRKPRFVQFIPTSSQPAMFQVVEETKGLNYWHAIIKDAIVGDYPEFRYQTPKKGCPYTVQELANTVAGELNEATGRIVLQEIIDGIPANLFVFISNGRQVMCIKSSNSLRCSVVNFDALLAWMTDARARGVVFR